MGKSEAKKRAAIDLEAIKETPLAELSADQFLEALHEEKALRYLPYWPEKKKYELYVEPENVGKIPVGRIVDILKGEKKKVEYELPFPIDRVADGSPQPAPWEPKLYEALLNRLADDLEVRLRERLG